MTTTKKPTATEAKGNKHREHIAHLAKCFKDHINNRTVRIIGCFAAILGIGLVSHFFFNTYTPSMAALYAFANDGVISGRQSNSVKTRNGVERMFVVPRLVRNTFTQNARAIFAQFSQSWNGITDAERLSWTNAEGNFKSNRLGKSILVKGKQLYIDRNVNLLNSGGTAVDAYPGNTEFSPSGPVNLTATTTAGLLTTLSVSFVVTPVPADTAFQFWATAPKSAGTMRPKASAYRLISVFAPADTSPQNVLAAYIARFGAAAQVDGKIGVYIKSVNILTGQAAVSFTDIAIVT